MSIGKFHPDEAVTDSPFVAAYASYLGYPIQRCTSAGRNDANWTFLIPEHDFQIVLGEFADDQPIQVKSYAAALKEVFSFQRLAREHMGEFSTDEWKSAIRRR